MKTNLFQVTLLLILSVFVIATKTNAEDFPRHSSLYPVVRNNVSPSNKAIAALNPPTFLWPRPGYRENESGNTRFDPPKAPIPSDLFQVEFARDEAFTQEKTISPIIRTCFFKSAKALAEGKWFWRYRTIKGDKSSMSPIYSFSITSNTPIFVTPSVTELVNNLPKQRPYILSYGKSREEMIAAAKKYPKFAEASINQGEQALTLPFIDIKTLDSEKMGFSAWLATYTKQTAALPKLCQAYILTGDSKYFDFAVKRIEQILSLSPQRGMDGAEHARYLGIAYDTFHDKLEPELKKRILADIQDFLEFYYQWWPGDKEVLFLENHFWQKEISGFFFAALATVADVPENIKYLEYAYGIFLARVPVAGGNDGGWANGLPYFTVNYSTVADMAYYLHVLGKINIFEMPWYMNLPYYYLYCGMPYAPMDGFGNMHDRAYSHYKHTKIGWNFGSSMCQYIAVATNNPIAKSYIGLSSDRIAFLALSQNSELKFPKEEIQLPDLPQAKLFQEVGVSAMHTDLMNPKKDMAVYFRSSPFGNYGHMHANQNAFNIAFRGERIFYSSGYYTNFDDRHNLTSYRHTNGHNAILISGRGQALGPEGYGWIKRYAHGDQISYVCGDASQAYRPVVDKMWKDLLDIGLSPEEQNRYYGDAKLKTFDRHLIFMRPNTVLIYDVLESEEPQDWSWLIHTYQPPKLDEKSGILQYNLPEANSTVNLFASQAIVAKMTDQFPVDPRPLNLRYKNAANQYHISWNSIEKSKAIRFLSVIQCVVPGESLKSVIEAGEGQYQIGNIKVKAAMNPNTPPTLTAETDNSIVFVNNIPDSYKDINNKISEKNTTLIMEKINGKWQPFSTVDMPPKTQSGTVTNTK